MTGALACLVTHRIFGNCPECRTGFPQWCRGRGGVPGARKAKAVARGTKVERRCECCAKPFTARTADVNRGWARFCSKSCKASKQAPRTVCPVGNDMDGVEAGWDGHKEVFP